MHRLIGRSMMDLRSLPGANAAVILKRLWRKRFPAALGLAAALGACGGAEVPAGPPAPKASGGCEAPAFAAAAEANAVGMRALAFSLFGLPEVGWGVYGPLLSREVRTACPLDSSGFARDLAAWAPGRSPDGVVDLDTLKSLAVIVQGRRPIVKAHAGGACPEPPDEAGLAAARPEEGYKGKLVSMRPEVLEAYRRMVAAARAAEPEIASDPQWLSVVSAYRSPAYDAARCASEGNCDGVRRAVCSPHRTGLALDLYVGEVGDLGPLSVEDANRLAQSRTAAYRWLVANASRFGFVNYPFEPWHWEWAGER